MAMVSPWAGSVCAFIIVTLHGGRLSAQQPATTPEPRTVSAVRLAPGESITLDGNLDEGIWLRAEPARDFIQVDPQNGQPATDATEVRIAFNSESF